MDGQVLAAATQLFLYGRGIGELGFFLSEQLQDGSAARLVGLLDQETPKMLDI
jgi:hypothetical protein